MSQSSSGCSSSRAEWGWARANSGAHPRVHLFDGVGPRNGRMLRKYFQSIADDIATRHDPEDPDHIVTAAVHVLRAAKIDQINAAECLEWASTSATLPEQTWDFDFGDPRSQ